MKTLLRTKAWVAMDVDPSRGGALLVIATVFAIALGTATGCASAPPRADYALFQEHMPHSIVVLPPLNESTEVIAPYSYLSFVTEPLAERGYYVFPVAVVDHFLKENGMPSPGEMHQIPVQKLHEVLGADAVFDITVAQYGAKFQVVNSTTVVKVRARLVDARSGVELWKGERTTTDEGRRGGSGSGLLGAIIGAMIKQAVSSASDSAARVAYVNAYSLVTDERDGFLKGPRHKDFRGNATAAAP